MQPEHALYSSGSCGSVSFEPGACKCVLYMCQPILVLAEGLLMVSEGERAIAHAEAEAESGRGRGS